MHEEVGHLTNRDEDKAATFYSFFTSVSNINGGPVWGLWSFRTTAVEIIFCQSALNLNFLLQMNAQKSTGLNRIHPRILKEMADGIAEPHFLSAVL